MCLSESCEAVVIPVACDLFLVLFYVHVENHKNSGDASELSDIHCFLSSQKFLFFMRGKSQW